LEPGTETTTGVVQFGGGVVPGAGIASAEYCVTAADAGSGAHDTSPPRPCGETDSTKGAGAFAAATRAAAVTAGAAVTCAAAARVAVPCAAVVLADAVPAPTTPTAPSAPKSAIVPTAASRRIAGPPHPKRLMRGTASHFRPSFTMSSQYSGIPVRCGFAAI
jgi:hypothetical protein